MVPQKSQEQKDKEEKAELLSYAGDVLQDATDYQQKLQKDKEEKEYAKQSVLEQAGMANMNPPEHAQNLQLSGPSRSLLVQLEDKSVQGSGEDQAQDLDASSSILIQQNLAFAQAQQEAAKAAAEQAQEEGMNENLNQAAEVVSMESDPTADNAPSMMELKTQMQQA